ncbi:MAG: trigger factor [Sedimentisphaerales bacterium]|nr:trigger factor [Sedimentisphaerales bacterium]
MGEEETKASEEATKTADEEGKVGEEEPEPASAKNIVTIEDAGPCKKKVAIEIPEETIRGATDKQYNELRREAVLPGFRKGRAPRRLLEKRFGKETGEQIKLKLLAEASEAAVKELKVIGDPDIDYEKIEMPAEGAMKFDFEVEVRPEFQLPNLEGIPVNRTKLEVTDEQIDREIEQMRKLAGMWTPREEGAVEVGDQVIGEVGIKAEGAEEEEKLGETQIFVRPNGFVGAVPVEKLDKLLVGAKGGEKKSTTVEVPKTYVREEYRGKKVDISIEIKDIKWLKPAELDEAFFRRAGVEDADELCERTQDGLQSHLERQSRAEMTEQIYKYLLDNTSFDLPLDVVAEQAGTVLQRQYVNLLSRGLTREQIEEQMEQLRAGSEEQAKEQLKTFFLMDKVADKLEIEVTPEEINGRIAQLALSQGQRPERMREEMARNGTLTQFELEVRQSKCIAKMLESAKITEVEPEKKARKARKTKKGSKESDKNSAKKASSTGEKQAKKGKTTAKKKTEE